ncbi:Protein of unknown function (DUF2911) [Terriglobus roseus DSM 18391]|uniref:DUF2911 domain-containing protein n=1 Tax=Terriglobus roseus (strain DSM 18391 / NRRL B-41598 / KBS 63) TaxID=926566 RepID=I3ZKF0_TERRK|nr:DUF2911 domain-containing protein [Terriglobus roseus]AFL89718.1 Protein of unknown function (DUF2911) [Terriglobus roseus DSM 18391]
MKKLVGMVALAACCSVPMFAQDMGGMKMSKPASKEAMPSPRHEADVDLAGKKVHISYGAPSVRGRKVLGTDLVPYTTWWRTGANEATTFETTGDVMVGSLHVPAGKYTLVTLPAEGQWQLVLCKHTGQWGTERFAAEDLGKVPMMKTAIPKQELMSIGFEKTAGKKTQLHIKWDTFDVSVPVTAM